MEQWTDVRRAVLVEGISKRAACRRFGIHWDTLQRILQHSAPPGYLRKRATEKAVIAPWLGRLGELIEANRERLGLDPANPIIKVGDELLVPPPGTELSTATPLPEGLPRGTRIEYTVQSGDTLAAIAAEFNSTVDDILEENELEDPNAIFVGQILTIRVNLVTPVPTITEPVATLTPTTGG